MSCSCPKPSAGVQRVRSACLMLLGTAPDVVFGAAQHILALALLVDIPPTPGDHRRGPLALAHPVLNLLPACRDSGNAAAVVVAGDAPLSCVCARRRRQWWSVMCHRLTFARGGGEGSGDSGGRWCATISRLREREAGGRPGRAGGGREVVVGSNTTVVFGGCLFERAKQRVLVASSYRP